MAGFDRLDLLRVSPPGWRDGIAAAEARAATAGRSRLAVAQATDMADWLPHDLLLKLDRCLMAHAVEGRTPFLHEAGARRVVRLPDGLKVRDGRGKYLLRKWLGEDTPLRPGPSRRSRASPYRSAPGSPGRARGSARWWPPNPACRRSPSRSG